MNLNCIFSEKKKTTKNKQLKKKQAKKKNKWEGGFICLGWWSWSKGLCEKKR